MFAVITVPASEISRQSNAIREPTILMRAGQTAPFAQQGKNPVKDPSRFA